MKLFEYAVVLQEKKDKDGFVAEHASILVEPTRVLAQDETQAAIHAARAITLRTSQRRVAAPACSNARRALPRS